MEKNAKIVPFFYKERKITQRSFRSFEKNGCPTLKSAHTKIVFYIFKGCTWNKMCSLFYFKAKNEEKLEKNIFLLFVRSKIVFAIFEKEKKYLTNSKFEFCFCQLFFHARWRFLQISPKKYFFSRSLVIFWK